MASDLRAMLTHVWPKVEPEHEINPPEIFSGYERTIHAYVPSLSDELIPTVLAQSQRAFEYCNDRRHSIDQRAAVLLQATGVTSTLVVATAGILLAQSHLLVSRLVFGVALSIVLVFLARSAVCALRVHGKVTRSTLGPEDALPSRPELDYAAYGRECIDHFLRFTSGNYRVDNKRMEVLAVAQGCYRNAVVAILAGGGVVILLELVFQQNP